MSVTAEHFNPTHEEKYHEFLIPDPDYGFDPIEKMIEFRETIAEFPQTKATFKQKHIRGDGSVNIPNYFWCRAVIFARSWRVSDTFTNVTGGATKYVNPNYPHRRRYADTAVLCDCGEIITKFDQKNPETKAWEIISNSHTDECRKEWEIQSRATLWKNRRQIINQGAWFGHSFREMTNRMDMSEISSANGVTVELEMDMQLLKAKALARIGRTVALLRDRYTVKKIARAYGISRPYASELYRKHPTDDTLEDVITAHPSTKFTIPEAKA
ncbi:hypothetical protein SAMN05421858_5087 [Haladaptatus litoreus]|uniref:Uncharacterized protein n=1 Tax=Haladaptatus litoreus TaxID=553468 RepID=A0A1N7FI89_9EURY|nr:hypothetical protein [Haladaptatus litoreus]SIS00007.1 hypothetical protein SAMN05421858_5087 [Haladaptatus litoreus]